MEREVHHDSGGAASPAFTRMAGDDASAHGRRPPAYKVLVDLPDPLPVTEAELDLLESELAAFIAELLAPPKRSAARGIEG